MIGKTNSCCVCGGGVEGGDVINGIIEQYVVNAGENVSAGDFVEFVSKWNGGVFGSSSVTYVSAVSLGAGKVLIAYRDGGNSGYGTAVLATISGTAWSVGTPTVFYAGTYYYISAVALTSDKVLVAYSPNDNRYLYACILTVNGTTITAGNTTTMSAYITGSISAVALTSDKVLVAYYDGNVNAGKAVILSINGTTITTGAICQIESGSTADISAVALTSDKVLVAYSNLSGGYGGYARILTVTGTTIGAGSRTQFTSNVSTSYYGLYTSVAALTSEKVLVAHTNHTASRYGTACILTVNGTTITAGNNITFNSSVTNYISAVALTSDKVLVAFNSVGDNNYGTARVLSVNGTAITAGSNKVFSAASASYISAVAQSSSSVLVAFNVAQGRIAGLSVNGTTITNDNDTGVFVNKVKSRLHIDGIAKTEGTSGQTIDIYVPETAL